MITTKKYGKGRRSVLFFPGWTHPIENEKKLLKTLSNTYTIHSINPPGYNNNPDGNHPYTLADLADSIHIYIKKEKLNNATLIGFSMGCKIIMQYIKKYRHTGQLVFIGCPTKEYPVPAWGRLVLKNKTAIEIIRQNQLFKRAIVNKALSILNEKPTSFTSNTVTTAGAFDSLIALLKDQNDWKVKAKKATFIYGSQDPYLTEFKKHFSNAHSIKNAPHNCIIGNEREMSKVIAASLHVGEENIV